MSEITVHFKNALYGYNKKDVDRFLNEEIEKRLQEKNAEIVRLQKQVAELEERIHQLTDGDETVEQKVEQYEKLVKKMDGDYDNLLAPAIEKAKEIEEKANREYEIRMDQAKYSADGIYADTAERIAEVFQQNLKKKKRRCCFGFFRSKVVGVADSCKKVTHKVAEVIVAGEESVKRIVRKAKKK